MCTLQKKPKLTRYGNLGSVSSTDLTMQVDKLRGILGKLNWIAGMTRPEISFFVCEASDPTISDLISANKIVKFVKNTPIFTSQHSTLNHSISSYFQMPVSVISRMVKVKKVS